MRNAIEAVGFMSAIKTDQEKANIWMSKQLGEEKEEFKALKKERWTSSKIKLLRKNWNFASEQCHANFSKTTYSTESKLDVENKQITDKFSFFDSSKDRRRDRSLMNFFIGASFDIFQLYCEIFGEVLEKNGFKNKLSDIFTGYSKYLKENAKDIISTPKLRKKFNLD